MNNESDVVIISNENLIIEQLVLVATSQAKLKLSEEIKQKVIDGRKRVDKIIEEEKIVYGITTGVGENSKIRINSEDSKQLQKNLIMSHACGVGEPLEKVQVRAVMVMMVKNLSFGYSGIRLETIEMLVKLLNRDITPYVPKEGSLGYLIYQSHISLVLLGMGEAYYKGELLKGEEVLEKAGIQAIELHEKEGLSLINGTVDMTALAAIAIYNSINLLKNADIVSMMSFEALKGTYYAYDRRISEVKAHLGQKKTIENIHKIIDKSEIAVKFKDYRTQDALSIRSIPQVHGASKDAINYAKKVVEIEMNSATDNPLLFQENIDERIVISSSNCHGQSVSLAMDFLTMAISEIASISERRTYRLLTSNHSELPPFLIRNEGLNSGYMIPQYVSAALVSDNKVYSHPSSVDSITTSSGQEDHVSMGTSSALKSLKIISNTEKVIGIELLCGAQGLDFLKPLHSGLGTELAYQLLREYVSTLTHDRVIYKDIQKAEKIIKSGEIVKLVEQKVGELQV